MSRTELARRLGLRDPSAVSHWEKGRNEPSLDTLDRIAGIVGAGTLVGFLAARVPRGFAPRVVLPRAGAR